MKKNLIVLLLLLISAFILIFFTGCSTQKESNPSPSQPANKISREELLLGLDPLPFNYNDIDAAGLKLDMTFQEVVSILGTPLKTVKQIDGVAFAYTLTVKYPFGLLKLDAINQCPESETILSSVVINKPGYFGPRKIQVGDNIDTVISKFYKSNKPKKGNKQILYDFTQFDDVEKYQFQLYGGLSFNKTGKIESIEYVDGYGGFSTFILKCKVQKNKVIQIELDVNNL